MATAKRRVSPRAPSLTLEDALNRALKMYKAEGMHATPIDVAFRHIGYAGRNGAAAQALASLGYWGLTERPQEGMVKVTKEVEDYRYTPDDERKRSLLFQFLHNPQVFSNLLEKYKERLPSDGTVQYDLIQAGFTPDTAASCLNVFKKAVEYAGFYDNKDSFTLPGAAGSAAATAIAEDEATDSAVESPTRQESFVQPSAPEKVSESAKDTQEHMDRIPVRLAGGRRAWLEIPSPFFVADRKRLKKQIDLLFVDDDEEEDATDE